MVEIDHGFTTEMKYAVAGMFTNGLSSKIFPKLKDQWYNVAKVYAVCDEKKDVYNGDISFQSLAELPEQIDVLIIVHKEDKTMLLLQEVEDLPYRPSLWFMPRTLTPKVRKRVNEIGLLYAESCLMGHMKRGGLGKLNLHNVHSYISHWKKIGKQ